MKRKIKLNKTPTKKRKVSQRKNEKTKKQRYVYTVHLYIDACVYWDEWDQRIFEPDRFGPMDPKKVQEKYKRHYGLNTVDEEHERIFEHLEGANKYAKKVGSNE